MATGNPLIDGMMAGEQMGGDLVNAHAQHQMLLDAQKKADLMAQNPLMGMPGVAGQEGAIQHVGADSPAGLSMQQSIDNQAKALDATAKYKNAMANYVGTRYMTAKQKTQQDAALGALGYPTTMIASMNDAEKVHALQSGKNYDPSVSSSILNPNAAQPQPQQGNQFQDQSLNQNTLSSLLQNPPQTGQQAQPSNQDNINRLHDIAQHQASQSESAMWKSSVPASQAQMFGRLTSTMTQLQDAIPNLDAASQYVDLKGLGTQGFEKSLSNLGLNQNDPNYQKAMQFNQTYAIVKDELAKGLGLPADQESRQEIQIVMNPKLAKSPEQFKTSFLNVYKMVEDQRHTMGLLPSEQQHMKFPSTAQVSQQIGLTPSSNGALNQVESPQTNQMVSMQFPDGSVRQVPSDQVQKYSQWGKVING